MSDLISRSMYKSKLLKALDVLNKEYREAILNEDNDLILAIQNQQSAYMIALRLLDNEPTAYDIDNVVGELEEAKVILANEYYCKTIYGKKDCENSNCFECCADYLIEIVKHGGAGTEAETIRDKAVKWNNNSSKRVPYEFIDYVEGKREIGVADDVCEWNLDGLYIFSPHSKMFSSVIDDKHRYTYCPVCGKKIKVVE